MNWFTKEKPLSIEEKFSNSLNILRKELKDIHRNFDLVIFPGNSAINMWYSLQPENLPQELTDKVKLVDHANSVAMYDDGDAYSQLTATKRIIGQAGSVLVVDDFAKNSGSA